MFSTKKDTVSIAISLLLVFLVAGFIFESFVSPLSEAEKPSNTAKDNSNNDHTEHAKIINYLSPYAHSVIQDINIIKQINKDISYMISSESSNCMTPWPNVRNCAFWYESKLDNKRYLLTNSVPIYYVAPYCPFGIGYGYCFTGNKHTNCSVFYNMTCPAQTHRENTTGDVMVPQIILFGVELNPNPLNNSLPFNLYSKNPYIWGYHNGSNVTSSSVNTVNVSETDVLPGYQVIGIHRTGQQIKGPEEAEGMNVDFVGLHLETMCGGHVTPPVGSGPLYHYHKAALCLETFPNDKQFESSSINDKNETNEINEINEINEKLTKSKYSHSSIQGYANDGFGIYGLYDFDLETPILDECNGHFGATGKYRNGKVVYHYHYQNYTFDYNNRNNNPYLPYYIGCQGPSKGFCNTTVSNETIEQLETSPICGQGCGYQVCVQPGTSKQQLNNYFTKWGNANWLDQFTVNPF